MHGEVKVWACAVFVCLQELINALQATATAHLQAPTAAQKQQHQGGKVVEGSTACAHCLAWRLQFTASSNTALGQCSTSSLGIIFQGWHDVDLKHVVLCPMHVITGTCTGLGLNHAAVILHAKHAWKALALYELCRSHHSDSSLHLNPARKPLLKHHATFLSFF